MMPLLRLTISIMNSNSESRVTQLAVDSQLLISEEVWNAVSENALEAILIGETQVKGRAATIQVYKLG